MMIPAVVLETPKYGHNIGAAIRACSCWGVPKLWYTGDRSDWEEPSRKGARIPREERMKGYAEVDWERDNFPLRRYKQPIVPIGVELRDNSESLVDFVHPENAVYIFGPEDGSLSKGMRAACHRFIVIPTHYCLNLAAAVNVVLFDRRVKRINAGLESGFILDIMKEDRGFVEV